MVKRFTIALSIIFMITILFPISSAKVYAAQKGKPSFSFHVPESLTKAFQTKNDKAPALTTGITAQAVTAQLSIPSLTQWILDVPTNTLYAISQENKALYFINATTLKLYKTLTFEGGPTDIIVDSGKLYITLDNLNQIAIVDMISRTITKKLSTLEDPYRIVKDGNKLYYAQLDQWCNVHSYDLTTDTDQKLSVGLVYYPDLAINTNKHILYIGESGLSGSDMIYYSTIDNKVIGSTNYDKGYGFPGPSRYTLFDGENVYYASRDFTSDNPRRCLGDFTRGSDIIFAKNGLTFTKTSIYDVATHIKLGDYDSNIDLAEASGTTVYLYSSASGSIKSFNNSNNPVNKTNIISLISGKPVAQIQTSTNSTLLDSKTRNLEMDSTLTQWLLDEKTNTIYGISDVDKALFFINATTLNLEKSITFTSGPTDIILDSGKLYVSLDDINEIAVVDSASRQTTGILYTSSDPYRIVKDGNKIYYTENDQWCSIYSYDLTACTDQIIKIGTLYNPDLAINTDKHILYIGESGSSGSNMYYYSTTNDLVVGRTIYDNGYGFPYPSRHTLFDEELVYYAGRDFHPENSTSILGNYGEDIINAKYGLAFSNSKVYDSYTNELVADFGVQIDLAEFSNRTDLYLYNIENKSILKFEPDTVPPVVNGVSPNSGPIKGGTVVNITGTGFTGATEVYFGDTLGTNLKVNSDTSITVTAPSSSYVGYVDIFVVGPNGYNVISRSDRFTYIGLTVNVTANNGMIFGLNQSYKYGDTVTLTAAPVVGYIFKNWTDKSGKILSTNPVYSFTINDNVELNANFVDVCDINKDNVIDIMDLASIAKNYNMKEADAKWISALDFNNDGTVDLFDLVLCSKKITR